jgi:NTP pyrophosphatase (non-canonical NTP hydrolase)
MDDQARVAAFLDEHDLETDPAYHALDLAAEVGEIAADVNDSTDYGANPDAATVPRDELGDALFALLATCESLDVDASAALSESLEKYERRIAETGDVGSEA